MFFVEISTHFFLALLSDMNKLRFFFTSEIVINNQFIETEKCENTLESQIFIAETPNCKPNLSDNLNLNTPVNNVDGEFNLELKNLILLFKKNKGITFIISQFIFKFLKYYKKFKIST